ncbi:Sorting nexin-1 OS=Pongo abelii GN=SNX1 PE=2 SV=1 [Rhizoctonia solani AG-1 IB]|uniref:Sorting nexin-1 n=1 Tax=Thanatephorus cucumeris (strain AG1-IB / isolate 7/3/14) TaxID=1108050 RepID=M5C7M7_THACB|nr:Sorting nexin-1 [Rhizoctonia solani AG-1 IB]CEL63003.1 Sorting nexin-1 OS=Pongo abelii GN=SNX1 PE=2 SV=1 [Rhizoctonia solani AG-1 IB]
MSGGFGDGFGGDFDDLLPSRPAAPPNLGNPFEDPFADMGRSHENDPWASYEEPKAQSPTTTFSQNHSYETPATESEDQPNRKLEFSSPPSPPRDSQITTLYSTTQQDHIDSTNDTFVSDYRAVTPTPPEPAPPPQESNVSQDEPVPAVKAPATAPISPSKAGLFDEPDSSTFGSGFINRHKPKRTSLSNTSGVAPLESPRSGSLFSSAKVDPLEALISKARSASTTRGPAPAPGKEATPEVKESTSIKSGDSLVTENPGTTQSRDNVIPAEEVSLPRSASATPPPTTEDGASTPKRSSIPPESPAAVEVSTKVPPTSSVPPAGSNAAEASAAPSAADSGEAVATPTPPSHSASDSLASSLYPEGSTFLNPPQASPGPGAYARIVSPLDTPAASSRNLTQSFTGLALGGEVPNLGWGGQSSAPEVRDTGLPPVARSAGWGAVDSADGWGGESSQTGWGGENEAHFIGQSSHPEQGSKGDESVSGHSRKPSESNESEHSRKETPVDLDRSSTGTPQQSAPRSSESNGPFTFHITVGDPQKVGDPINPYIVYTVTTKTNSPHYRKPHISVLRRYSDFLWLFETLSFNKPGVFVPPVPEKQGFGRFQGAFVEQRRSALNNCIQKIANHPLLSADDDFKFFIESDSFALDVKHRKAEIAQEKTGGFLSSITGPKFYETDEWFDTKRSYIDALESQLRGLAKSVDTVSKNQAEVAVATGEFAETLVVLSNSDLSKQLSQSLATLADVQKKARKLEEEQSQDDIILLMGIVDEYIRLIGSIRLTFASRIRLHAAWQNANAEAKRVRTAHEKARRQGRIPQDRVGMSMHEVAEAEKRAADAKFEFDQCSRLIKAEMARFEKERIDDFKKNLELLLEGMIRRQQDVIESFENYQEGLLRRSRGILNQPNTEQPNTEQPKPEKPVPAQD